MLAKSSAFGIYQKKKVSLLFLIFFFVYRKYSVLYLVDEIIVLWLVAIRAMTYIY